MNIKLLKTIKNILLSRNTLNNILGYEKFSRNTDYETNNICPLGYNLNVSNVKTYQRKFNK